jgi:hypothetical protein
VFQPSRPAHHHVDPTATALAEQKPRPQSSTGVPAPYRSVISAASDRPSANNPCTTRPDHSSAKHHRQSAAVGRRKSVAPSLMTWQDTRGDWRRLEAALVWLRHNKGSLSGSAGKIGAGEERLVPGSAGRQA